jgi:hypothetical protein
MTAAGARYLTIAGWHDGAELKPLSRPDGYDDEQWAKYLEAYCGGQAERLGEDHGAAGSPSYEAEDLMAAFAVPAPEASADEIYRQYLLAYRAAARRRLYRGQPVKTYCVEVDTMDFMAVRDALFALEQETGVHLGAITACTDGKTRIQHWCDPESARKAAQLLTAAGFPAREKPNPET